MKVFKIPGGFDLRCPDELSFVFNPCIISIAPNEEYDSETIPGYMNITISDDTGQSDSLRTYSFGLSAMADIREYVQAFFDIDAINQIDYTQKKQKSAVAKKVEILIEVSKDLTGVIPSPGVPIDGRLFATRFDVLFVWGAMKLGGTEKYERLRTMTWFKGYPFTYGIYATGKGSVILSRDGNMVDYMDISDEGVWNIRLDDEMAKRVIGVSVSTEALQSASFDFTFDLTFRAFGGGVIAQTIKINVMEGYDEGVYLRWIDRQGFFNYYLFKQGNESRQVASDGEFLRNNLLAYDMSYGYKGGYGRQQAKTRKDVISVCAPLVDNDTFESLFDITSSPIVDMYCGNDDAGCPKWLAVNIQAGTYVKDANAQLQDFVCNIIMPEIEIQRL